MHVFAVDAIVEFALGVMGIVIYVLRLSCEKSEKMDVIRALEHGAW